MTETSTFWSTRRYCQCGITDDWTERREKNLIPNAFQITNGLCSFGPQPLNVIRAHQRAALILGSL
jgi:hypothetical protein